ncbi:MULTISPECIES: hypothetical protein [Aeromonas]|uniref:hypothetical protein n=1 Tax=Aeromonas sp. QDB14 TaxID=2989836 RepID=UPI0022E80D56|nr:hypothetical protein [Aeromonas sp. QDB14]
MLPAEHYQAIFASMLGDVYEAIQAASRLQGEVERNHELFGRIESLLRWLSRERQEIHDAATRFGVMLGRLDEENERFIRLHRSTLDAMRSELEFIARSELKVRESKLNVVSCTPWLIAIISSGITGYLLGIMAK